MVEDDIYFQFDGNFMRDIVMTNGWDGVPGFQRNPWEGNISDWQKMGGTGDLVDPDGSLP